MNIFVCGSGSLTTYDKKEVRSYLENFVGKHNIYVLCYYGVEREVLDFFVENDEYASKLHVYSFQPLSLLLPEITQSILYLKEKGTSYHSFERNEQYIKRTPYENAWRSMLVGVDLVTCFYNRDKTTALIPVDIAKELNVDAMIYDLPGYKSDKIHIPFENKLRVV